MKLFRVKPGIVIEDKKSNFYFVQHVSWDEFINDDNLYQKIKSITQSQTPTPEAGDLYAINEDIRVGIELGYRKTFTDYLDDVSGGYFDEAALLVAKGQTAVDLAYRGDEVGTEPYPAAKTPRGGAEFKDAYYYGAITVTVRSFIDQYKRIAGLPDYKRDKKVGCPANHLF